MEITPIIRLEVSIKALTVYPISKEIIQSMLDDIEKIKSELKQKSCTSKELE